MEKILQKIYVNPLLSFVAWMILLSTKYIIKNDAWGILVELGGAIFFLSSLYKWSKRLSKKPEIKK